MKKTYIYNNDLNSIFAIDSLENFNKFAYKRKINKEVAILINEA